jgi:hypothetical protein
VRRAALIVSAALAAATAVAACRSSPSEAAPDRSRSEQPTPQHPVARVSAPSLCVTKGSASLGGTIKEPTVRAVALGSSGEAASLAFVFRGDTAVSRELASGEDRRQLGLKLRAQDGCNLIYVMWRQGPRPAVTVSLKLNPGKRTHRDCGTDGYTRLKPARAAVPSLAPVPALSAGASHTLRAEIVHDDLLAWIDDQLVWRGPLTASARDLSGPAGLRSDNISFDLVSFDAAPASAASPSSAKCTADAGD